MTPDGCLAKGGLALPKRIFYVSVMAAHTTDLDIRAIVSASTIWNRRQDITGLLLATRTHFAQVLEGRAEAIAAVMERIRSDDRHRSIEILVDVDAAKRQFGGWAMAYLRRDDCSQALEQMHMARDPAQAQAFMSLLEALSIDLASEP